MKLEGIKNSFYAIALTVETALFILVLFLFMFVEMDDENTTFTTAYISTKDSIYTVNMQDDTEWVAWCPNCHRFEQLTDMILSDEDDVQFKGKCMRCREYINISGIQSMTSLDDAYKIHFDFTVKEN